MTIEEMKRKKQEYGLTCEMIAQASQVPLGTVQKIFSGKTRSPRYDTLRALEEMFMNFAHRRDYLESEAQANEIIEMHEEVFQYEARKGKHTIDEYEKWGEDIRCELIDGELFMMTAPTITHQRIALELAMILENYTRSKGKGCMAGIAPTDFQLSEDDDKTIVQPDVYMVCDKSKDREKRFVGAPDLAIEILSPSTSEKDLLVKYKKYRETGVREYWLVNYERETVLVNDFEHEMPTRIYGIREKIPVSITGGELVVDFAAIDDYIKGV